jgi:UDP-galactopyranose mutase
MQFDWIIVGAGFTGAVLAERIAAQNNQKALVVDRRIHIGGNAYDYYDDNHILIHKYGPHIFHTNDRKVWDYLSQFTKWRIYFHKVLTAVNGQKVPIPFNLNTLYALFPKEHAQKVEQRLIERFGYNLKVPILELLEVEDKDLKSLADFIYQKFFLSYTLKQWGMKPEDLDSSVTSRVPVLISKDNRYFQDIYQGIPQNGYSALFRKMLDHANIKLLLNTDYAEIVEDVKFNRMIYTGPIDAFFDYVHGELPYRSLNFEFIHHRQEYWQEVAQINYPNEFEFTRITEYKHLTGQSAPGTTITEEYSQAYEVGRNEPYYPIPNAENFEKLKLYRKEIDKLNGTVIFAGRLADYKYYNMDQAVQRALAIFEKKLFQSQP